MALEFTGSSGSGRRCGGLEEGREQGREGEREGGRKREREGRGKVKVVQPTQLSIPIPCGVY